MLWHVTLAAEINVARLATEDGLIAATPLHHGMHVVTRNVKDFELTGALLINPWEVEADADP